jgi:hypothetical protein
MASSLGCSIREPVAETSFRRLRHLASFPTRNITGKVCDPFSIKLNMKVILTPAIIQLRSFRILSHENLAIALSSRLKKEKWN